MNKKHRDYSFKVKVNELLFKKANFARQDLDMTWPQVIERALEELIKNISNDVKKEKK